MQRSALLYGIKMVLQEGAVSCCPWSVVELGRSPCGTGPALGPSVKSRVAVPSSRHVTPCNSFLVFFFFPLSFGFFFFPFVITSAWEEFRSWKKIQSPFLCEWQDKTSQSLGRISVVKARSVPRVHSLAGAVLGAGLPLAGLSTP